MAPFPKFISLSVLAGGLLSVAGCREGTSNQSNPNPKTPPLTMKVTGPPGSRKMDSTAFKQMLQGPGVPDSLPPQRPAPKLNP